MRRRRFLAAAGSLITSLPLPARAAAPVTVFAAASLHDALRELGQQWQVRGNPAPRFSFAASSALARQIEQGAPADLFMSADDSWMDHVQERHHIANATRLSTLGNRLVLVAPASAASPLALTRDTELATLLRPQERIATADPAHAPLGRYARAALEWMGQWQAIGPRLARTENVRVALLLVERGEARFGIVYETDARNTEGVRQVAAFPAESHPEISYAFALTRRAESNPAAHALLRFLTSPDSAATWRRFGFLTPA
jgi:molybdate transport system substrate-binding protein